MAWNTRLSNVCEQIRASAYHAASERLRDSNLAAKVSDGWQLCMTSIDPVLSNYVVTDAVDFIRRHVEDWFSHLLSGRTRSLVLIGLRLQTHSPLTFVMLACCHGAMTAREVTDEETARQALLELKERRAELHRRYAEKRAELQAQLHVELQAQFSPEFEDFRQQLDKVLNSIKECRTLSVEEAAAIMEVSRQRLHQMRSGQQH